MLINARSLLNKTDELRLTADLRKPSIICVTETWLNDSIDSSVVGLKGYSLCRCDRAGRRGGGTCIYVRTHIPYKTLSVNNSCKEIEVAAIDLIVLEIFLLCLYVPPGLSREQLTNIDNFLVLCSDMLLAQKPNYRLIVAGDLNSLDTVDLCNKLSLVDLVNKPTRQVTILDHIFVSSELAAHYDKDAVTYDAPLGNGDHLVIIAFPNTQIDLPNATSTHTLLDLRHSNLRNLHRAMANINWTPLTEMSNVDEQWNFLYKSFTSAIFENIPSREVTLTNTDKAWMTPLK